MGLDAYLAIVRKIKDAKGFEFLPLRWIVERTNAWMERYHLPSMDCDRRIENPTGCASPTLCHFPMHWITREKEKLKMESVQSLLMIQAITKNSSKINFF